MKFCGCRINAPGCKRQLALVYDRNCPRQLEFGFIQTASGESDFGKQPVRQSKIAALGRQLCNLIESCGLSTSLNQISEGEKIFAKTVIKERVKDRIHRDSVNFNPVPYFTKLLAGG